MKKFIFYIVTLILSSLSVVLFIEIIFGNWIKVNKWQKAYYLNIIQNRQVVYEVSNLYGFKENTALHTRDKYGFRKSCNKPEEINILSIGGSTTDQRYINDGETFQDYIEDFYLKKNKVFCIANAGVSGHTTFGHLESFKSWFNLVENLSPNFFILYIGINDVGRISERINFDTLADKSVLREKSAIYYLASRLRNFVPELFKFTSSYGVKISPPEKKDYTIFNFSDEIEYVKDKNIKSFSNNLNLILKEIKNFNGIPICVSQPHLYVNKNNLGTKTGFIFNEKEFNGKDFDYLLSELNNEMNKLCTNNNGYYININEKKFTRDDFYDHVHLNPMGTIKLSKYLIEEFEKANIFN